MTFASSAERAAYLAAVNVAASARPGEHRQPPLDDETRAQAVLAVLRESGAVAPR
jgi:hypothetical protein